jgi:hypothetical protein
LGAWSLVFVWVLVLGIWDFAGCVANHSNITGKSLALQRRFLVQDAAP